MTVACSAPDHGVGVAIRLYGYVSCQAQALGDNGFMTLAQGSLFSRFVTGVMVLAVAMVGYRLLTGERPAARGAIVWMVRIGVVAALTGSWSAYGTLFYRTAFDSPMQIAAVILPAADLGDPGRLVDGIQRGYDGLIAAGRVPSTSAESSASAESSTSAQDTATDPLTTPSVPTVGNELSLRELAFSAIAVIFVASALGSLLAAQVATGLLLAVGPLFIASLLLDATRGLFEAWMRALVAAFLGTMATLTVVSIELGVLDVGSTRLSGTPPTMVDPIAIVTTFVIVLALGWWVCLRAAGRIRLPAFPRPSPWCDTPASPVSEHVPALAQPVPASVSTPAMVAPRVQAIAEAMLRRERVVAVGGHGDERARVVSPRLAPEATAAAAGTNAGSVPRRRTWRATVTASATRRDARA